MSDLDFAREFPTTCCEEVSRSSELEPCDKTAIAVREDPDGSPYPVCAYHARGRMVPLAELFQRPVANGDTR